MSKPKSVQSIIKLVIKAGQAKPAPPVGPALGQAGLNLMSFCKDFNAKTADIKVGVAPPHLPNHDAHATLTCPPSRPPIICKIQGLSLTLKPLNPNQRSRKLQWLPPSPCCLGGSRLACIGAASWTHRMQPSTLGVNLSISHRRLFFRRRRMCLCLCQSPPTRTKPSLTCAPRPACFVSLKPEPGPVRANPLAP